jgi:hypothetical protein
MDKVLVYRNQLINHDSILIMTSLVLESEIIVKSIAATMINT